MFGLKKHWQMLTKAWLTCWGLHSVGLTPEHMAMAAWSVLNTLKVMKPDSNSSEINRTNTVCTQYLCICMFSTWVSLMQYRVQYFQQMVHISLQLNLCLQYHTSPDCWVPYRSYTVRLQTSRGISVQIVMQNVKTFHF